MSDELVEAVARALAKEDRIEICSDALYRFSTYGHKARAAIAVVIERCAKVAEDEKWGARHVAQSYADGDAGPEWFNEALDTAAAAIRKLGESE